jgi:hypothetical protein
MRQTLHIVRKDLRRLRWWLAAWIALLAARVLLAVIGWQAAADGGLAGQFVMEQVGGIVQLVTWLMLALLVARLVHEEPLAGLDWFWLTRPYDRWALMGAKLSTAALFFVVVPLIAEIIVMAAFEAGPADMFRASSVFLARDLRWTLGLMVFAVLTPSLVTFALGIAGTAATLTLLMLATLTFTMLTFEGETAPAAAIGGAAPAVVATAGFVTIALAVIAYQYHRRRPRRAVLLGLLGAAALVATLLLTPWPTGGSDLALPAWAADPERVTVSVDRSVPPEIYDEPSFGPRARGTRHVYAAVTVTGVPADFRAQSVFARSRLEFSDGHMLQSGQTGGGAALVAHSAAGGPAHPLRGALGDLQVFPVFDSDRRPMTAVLSVSPEDLARYGPQPGRLTTTLIVPLQQSRAIAALPLTERIAVRSPDVRFELLRAQRRPDGCTLLLRHWRVSSLLAGHEHRQYDYVLRNAARGEAVVGTVQHGFTASSSLFLLTGMSLSATAAAGFSVQHLQVEFGRRWPGGQEEQVKMDAAWLDRADLVIVETASAGLMTRTITIEEFRMQEPSLAPPRQ